MKAKYFITALAFLSLMTSCEDWFSTPPESEMVRDDFWKKKSDVEGAIGACYRTLADQGVIKRLLVWGELRSDNVLDGRNREDNVYKILTANITADNEYTRWSQFYACINQCNTLIANAPDVQASDPDYAATELNAHLAEAKAIRAFCYLTLVRTFKDVPYVTEPYVDDSRPFVMPQTSGDEILTAELAVLKSIDTQAPQLWTENIPYTRGRITQKAVWTLEADIALWLNRYDDCVEACDKVLSTTANPLVLERASTYFRNVFLTGNSSESIWELQLDQNNQNAAVRDFFGLSGTDACLSSYNFSSVGGSSDLFLAQRDLRRMNAFVSAGAYYAIKKYTALRTNLTNVDGREADFQWGDANCNWILYRLPDIYLMKAEALAELGGSDNLQEAVRLCGITYDRANPDLEPGTLVANIGNQEEVRNLVLAERQREFLFEGKRYFDLMRRMRRDGTPAQVLETYLRKRYEEIVSMWADVRPKLNDVDAIYMPVNNDELRANPLLRQNRFYETSSDITR
jgi:hypothetical protein